jgi:hypothetical protein
MFILFAAVFIATTSPLVGKPPCHLLSNFKSLSLPRQLVNVLIFALVAWNCALPIFPRPSGLLSLSKLSRKGLFDVLSAMVKNRVILTLNQIIAANLGN